MWWAGAAENGWGLVLSQQYQTIFATWFTYDSAGQTTWFVMSNGTWTSSNTYTGTLYRARGAPVIGTAYNPAAFTLTQVGTLTLTFTDASHATMTYTIDGLSAVQGDHALQLLGGEDQGIRVRLISFEAGRLPADDIGLRL